MIRKASDINPNVKYRGLIYGVPGIRKSTTALSAPGTLFVDTDRGWERVDARFRKGDYIQPENYEELLADLVPETVANHETIVFDTGGALLELMKPYVIKQNRKNGQSDGVTISFAGYGAVSREFARLVNHCFYALGKNVLVVFHAKEENDGETKVYRLDVEGSTRNSIWKSMDFGCFMEMRGADYVVGFSPTERYFAKGTRGISGERKLPTCTSSADNTFIQTVFKLFADSNAIEMEMAKNYASTMEAVNEIVANVKDTETANSALVKFKELTHYFASKTEAWNLLKMKAISIGLEFKDGAFSAKE